jgi:hypothetical protein
MRVEQAAIGITPVAKEVVVLKADEHTAARTEPLSARLDTKHSNPSSRINFEMLGKQGQ